MLLTQLPFETKTVVGSNLDPPGVERAAASDDAVDLVAHVEEELCQVAAVLAGDAGDEGNFATDRTSAGQRHLPVADEIIFSIKLL